jgi:hypothetical protein
MQTSQWSLNDARVASSTGGFAHLPQQQRSLMRVEAAETTDDDDDDDGDDDATESLA